MTYFAVLGKLKQISLRELGYVLPTSLTTHGPIAIFDTTYPDRLAKLGGIIKWGIVAELGTIAGDTADIVGTNSRTLGKHLKSTGYTRRFKELTLDHCDREVHDKGKEIILIHSNETLDDTTPIGIVTGYQDIGLFEAVDFEKPSAGMGIGMMPSKLALTMINIAIAQHQSNHEIKSSNSEYPGRGDYTIYDPFCGFGTTNFLANAHGHNTIGSDINGSLIKPNLERWKNHALHTQSRITTFKHDATTSITKPFVTHTDVIVSEGWLGPIVTSRIMPKVAHHQLSQIGELYCEFINRVNEYFDEITMCITIPVYRFYEVNVILDQIITLTSSWSKRTITPLPQMYERKGQYLMRHIIVLQKIR